MTPLRGARRLASLAVLGLLASLLFVGGGAAAQSDGVWVRGDARVIGGETTGYTSGLGPAGGNVTLRVQTNGADAPGQAVFNVEWEAPPAVMSSTRAEPLSVELDVTSLAYEGNFSSRLSATVYLDTRYLTWTSFPFVDMSCSAGSCSTTPVGSSSGSVNLTLGAGSRDGQVKTVEYSILNCGDACAIQWDYTWDAGGSGSPSPNPSSLRCDGRLVDIGPDDRTPDGNIIGTSRDDVIMGTDSLDFIDGRGGNDVICGEGGDDIIRGGGGHDIIFGGPGLDTIRGEGGRDRIYGQAHPDYIVGGAKKDRIWGGGGQDIIFGETGNDILKGGSGADWIFGGPGGDRIEGQADRDFLFGAGRARQMRRTVDGLEGQIVRIIKDVGRANDGGDTIVGGPGGDVLMGGKGEDTMRGQGGRDTLGGQGGDDALHGGKQQDSLHGGGADDTLRGGGGLDSLHGDNGRDGCDARGNRVRRSCEYAL